MKGKARLESQLKLYIIMAVPTVIYGSETWFVRILRQGHRQKTWNFWVQQPDIRVNTMQRPGRNYTFLK